MAKWRGAKYEEEVVTKMVHLLKQKIETRSQVASTFHKGSAVLIAVLTCIQNAQKLKHFQKIDKEEIFIE